MESINRVLIIEDCIDDYEVYARILKKLNIVDLTHFNTAQKAYEVLGDKGGQFDIVLLDYNLPGMSGITFLQKLKQKGKEIDAPVIVLTGQGDEKTAINFMHLNVADYLRKAGLDQDKLVKAMTKARNLHLQKKLAQERQNELLLFAHTLAHDLKNPITRIQAYCSLMGKNPENWHKYHSLVLEDSSFLLEFIDKLLQYAEYGRAIDDMQEVNLNEVVARAIELLEVPIQKKKARFEFSQDLPSIHGSEMALVQLFQNLFSNSIKYCNHEPRIIIQSSIEPGKYKIVSVIDNGIGIPKEMAQSVFQPFYRLETASGVEGTGLGLAIVKSIIKQHSAEIEIMPLSSGTQFDIKFWG